MKKYKYVYTYVSHEIKKKCVEIKYIDAKTKEEKTVELKLRGFVYTVTYEFLTFAKKIIDKPQTMQSFIKNNIHKTSIKNKVNILSFGMDVIYKILEDIETKYKGFFKPKTYYFVDEDNNEIDIDQLEA
ncbi:MAG: hypothetical protein LBG67_03460, partial [Campylobacteraceae bacterium]|nr:hypothetical protein [Campylobacteraceae bacterium]